MRNPAPKCSRCTSVTVSFLYLQELSQEEREVGVGDELRAGEQGVEVEPLVPDPPHGQPVLAVVADEGTLAPNMKWSLDRHRGGKVLTMPNLHGVSFGCDGRGVG